jgi:tRNA (cytidine32/uridine32-2'-O)-methyltransferase
MLKFLQDIRIVLLHTTHPGNIGASARAMKVMGLERLYLVTPKYFPDAKATAMASGAADLLQHAVVCDDLETAIADCTLVLGASARSRTLRWPALTVREAASSVRNELVQHAENRLPRAPVAIVFGTESVGMSNEQMQRCHYRIEIPANPDYSSLNLSQAVQVVSYELRMAMLDAITSSDQSVADDGMLPADQRSVESLMQRTESMLEQIRFLHPTQPQMLLQRIRRLAMRSRLEQREVSILQGIVSAILDDREQ